MSGRLYLKFITISLAAGGLTGLLGYLPTKQLAGVHSLGDMWVGIAISVIASLVGALPVAAADPEDKVKFPLAVLMSTALRFLVVLTLALSLALSGLLDHRVMLVWVAISYLVLLLIDTIYAVRLGAKRQTTK